MIYGMSSLAENLPPAHNPNDTAGLKCPPEICPTAYAMVKTVKPNANATPANPIPNSGYAAEKMALTQPPNTSQ